MNCLKCAYVCPSDGDLTCFFTGRVRVRNYIDVLLHEDEVCDECDLEWSEKNRALEYTLQKRG